MAFLLRAQMFLTNVQSNKTSLAYPVATQLRALRMLSLLRALHKLTVFMQSYSAARLRTVTTTILLRATFSRFVCFEAKILLHLVNAAVERAITCSLSRCLRLFVEYSFLVYLSQLNILKRIYESLHIRCNFSSVPSPCTIINFKVDLF